MKYTGMTLTTPTAEWTSKQAEQTMPEDSYIFPLSCQCWCSQLDPVALPCHCQDASSYIAISNASPITIVIATVKMFPLSLPSPRCSHWHCHWHWHCQCQYQFVIAIARKLQVRPLPCQLALSQQLMVAWLDFVNGRDNAMGLTSKQEGTTRTYFPLSHSPLPVPRRSKLDPFLASSISISIVIAH